jgi:amidase
MIDHVGPMATTVLDTARLLQAVAGDDDIDDRSAGAPKPADVPDYVGAVLAGREKGVKGMKIGILKEPFDSPHIVPGVTMAVKDSAERLRALGAEVEEVSLPMSVLKIQPCSHHPVCL